MKTNISKIVRDYIKSNYINQTGLALEIGTTKQNLSNILRTSKTIDSLMLFNISVALKHDFFSYYTKELKPILNPVDGMAELFRDAALPTKALTEQQNFDFLNERFEQMAQKAIDKILNNSEDKNFHRGALKEIEKHVAETFPALIMNEDQAKYNFKSKDK